MNDMPIKKVQRAKEEGGGVVASWPRERGKNKIQEKMRET
jgi:hypothetical protein